MEDEQSFHQYFCHSLAKRTAKFRKRYNTNPRRSIKKKKEEERKGRIQIKEEGKGKFSEGGSMILFPSLSPPTSHFRRSRN